MQLPPLNTLRAFQLTARLMSVSRAGEEMNLTHAAVSNQIKRLEDWFGQRLFERVGRGVVLTPAGAAFQKAVDAALASIAAAAQELRHEADRKSVRVACVPSIAMRWLIPALSDFHERHKDINVKLVYAKGFETFDSDRYDVLITEMADRDASARAVKLFSRSNRPVASRAYIAKHRHFTEGSLEGARLLHDETTQDWEDWFEKVGYRPNKVSNGPVFGDFNLLSAALLTGQGVALCPIDVFRREISEGRLIVLSDVATYEQNGYYMLSKDSRNASVTTFWKWFAKVCA